MILWFVLLIGFAVFTPQAQAAPTGAEQQIIDRAAAQSFPGSACEGRTITVRSTEAELEAMTGWTPSTAEPGGAALQNNSDGTCRVYILDTIMDQLTMYDFCLVYVHEYGHLQGANHGDPLMGDNGQSWPPCLALRPVLTPNRGKFLLRAKLGRTGARYQCGPDSWSKQYVLCFLYKHRRWRAYGIDLVRYGQPAVIKFVGWGLDKR